MKKVYMFAFGLLMSVSAMAQSPQCSISDFSIAPGAKKAITLDLSNPSTPFCAFQFDLQLPEGISVEYDEQNDDYSAVISGNRIDGHNLAVKKVDNSVYRFLSIGVDFDTKEIKMNNFKGTDGALVNITLVAAADLELGEKSGSIINAKFTPKKDNSVTFDKIPFKVIVEKSLRGDVNSDGEVGVGDLISVSNYMARGEDSGVTLKLADVNGDGEVGVGDLITISNIMAGNAE